MPTSLGSSRIRPPGPGNVGTLLDQISLHRALHRGMFLCPIVDPHSDFWPPTTARILKKGGGRMEVGHGAARGRRIGELSIVPE